MERALLAIVGIVMALFGGLLLAVVITEVATGSDPDTKPDIYAGLFVFFGGMTLAGMYLAWRMLRPLAASAGAARPGTFQAGVSGDGVDQPGAAPPTDDAERERRVLRLAEREDGRVTIPEAAARCNMTIEEAKATLDRLVLHDVAEIQVAESGVLVYVFRGFLSDKDKAGATDF